MGHIRTSSQHESVSGHDRDSSTINHEPSALNKCDTLVVFSIFLVADTRVVPRSFIRRVPHSSVPWSRSSPARIWLCSWVGLSLWEFHFFSVVVRRFLTAVHAGGPSHQSPHVDAEGRWFLRESLSWSSLGNARTLLEEWACRAQSGKEQRIRWA